MSSIYDFYEEGLLLSEKTGNGVENYQYVCKLCKKLNRKCKNGEPIRIKQEKGNMWLSKLEI